MMSDMNTLARFGEESLNLLTLEEKGKLRKIKESFLVEHEENQFGLVAVLFFHIAFFVIAMVMFMSFKRDNDEFFKGRGFLFHAVVLAGTLQSTDFKSIYSNQFKRYEYIQETGSK